MWKKVYMVLFIKMAFSTFSCGGYNTNIQSLHVQVLHGDVLCDLWTKKREKQNTVSALAFWVKLSTLFFYYLFRQFCWFNQNGTRTETAQLKLPAVKARCTKGRVTTRQDCHCKSQRYCSWLQGRSFERLCHPQVPASRPHRMSPSSEHYCVMQWYEVNINNTTQCPENQSPW